jgi:hypothetical protein
MSDQPDTEPTPSSDEADVPDDLSAEVAQLQDDLVAAIEEMTEPVADDPAQRLELVAQRYRLDAHCREDLTALVDAHAALLAGGELPDKRHLSGLRHGIGHDEVVAAACEVLLGDGPDEAFVDALHTLAMALLDGASGSASAGARVLLGRCAEHRGDARAMEAQVEAALAADPQHWPALLDAAWFAEDRGDAVKAMSLLTETHVPAFSGEIERLARYTRTGDAKVGRNDPCPCGSGKKYKACCLGKGGFSLAERTGWLIHKAQGYAARSPRRPIMDGLAEAAAGAFRADMADGYRGALDEYPMVIEVALFEGGLLRAFLDERGYLLPEDERELAERWVDAPVDLWTIEEAEPTGSVTLGRGDEHVTIARPGAMAAEELGTHVLLRPLPMPDDGPRVLSATAVAPDGVARVEEVLAGKPTAVELATLIGVVTRIPPETLDGGDPLVLCTIQYSLPDDVDLPELAGRLDDELVDATESGEWFEPADVDGMDRGVAPAGSIVLYDDGLAVRAGTEARAERLMAVVARLIPEATLEEDTRRPRAEIIADLLTA